MGSHKAQLFFLDPLLKGHYIASHIPYLFDGAILNIEGIQNILGLGTDSSLIVNIVGNGPHLFPVKLLGVEPHSMIKVGFVNIEIHHARIWTANLGQIGITEAAANLGCTAPVLQLCLNLRIPALNYAGNNSMTLAGTLQISYHLTYGTAGIKLTQPGRNICVGIVRSQLLLDVYQYNRHIQITNGWQHIVGSRIGQKLENNQIHISSPELVPCLHGLLLGGYHATIDNLHCIWQSLLEGLKLSLELWYQLWELWQICS